MLQNPHLRALLFSNLAEIPDVKTSVGSGGREYGFVMRRPLDLKDLVFVRLERVEFQFEIAQIPQSDGLIGGPRRQNEFRVRIEGQAVDLGRVGVDDVRGFVGVVRSRVPNHQFLVVSDRAKERFVQQMP